MTEEELKKLRADFRLDLVRRLFAVAISIGVGAAIVNAPWVKLGRLPTGNDIDQILIVLLALIATVLSWDGYLVSVKHKPLNDWPRFAIDVFLVFTYMFLFVTSDKPGFWLFIICVMYACYIVWDTLTIAQFPTHFDKSPRAANRSKFLTVARVYSLAICDSPDVGRGPLISLVWASFFFFLLGITLKYPGFNVRAAICFALCALLFYRGDKARSKNEVRGFTAVQRGTAFIVLASAVLLFGYLSGAIHRA